MQSDIFVEALPGYPDNLSLDNDGQIWIALPSPRLDSFESLAERPFWRKVLMRLPINPTSVDSISWVVSVDLEGRVQSNLQDWTGSYRTVTSVNRVGDVLYLGSIDATAIARIALPPARLQ